MKKDNIAKIIVATVTSALSGALIGLLMAPQKGSSTRKKIVKESDKYLQDIKKTVAELRKDLNNSAKSLYEDKLEKSKKGISYDEWTKEELYNEAKEKEIESYSTMNKAELIEALRNS